ncbi:hypothetical protein [Roseibium marinum]|uniref:Uncharacterized protein n=1 Tax=Roseibium marinum TaxID=281252 RepID=A0A2S3V3U2_9HYPH|nr:hypothetical protein [Roseibium marinum]POF34657.1 hypothetical protein CLV41_1011114 [Roseibium marinum]
MSQQPFAGRAADLIAGHPPHEIASAEIWEQAAEDCVLARIKSMRLIGRLPHHKAPLGPEERIQRLKDLLRLWANGCTCAVDEDLVADIVNRQRR